MNEKNKNTGTEGMVAKNIETVTSKVPSDVYLWTAIGAMSASLCLKMMRKSHAALFNRPVGKPLSAHGHLQ